ncbi:hypothetical protein J7L09_00700 [bacterium]|nr:hypothetical protein [bacterium]
MVKGKISEDILRRAIKEMVYANVYGDDTINTFELTLELTKDYDMATELEDILLEVLDIIKEEAMKIRKIIDEKVKESTEKIIQQYKTRPNII